MRSSNESQRTRFVQGDFIPKKRRRIPNHLRGRNGLDSSRATSSAQLWARSSSWRRRNGLDSSRATSSSGHLTSWGHANRRNGLDSSRATSSRRSVGQEESRRGRNGLDSSRATSSLHRLGRVAVSDRVATDSIRPGRLHRPRSLKRRRTRSVATDSIRPGRLHPERSAMGRCRSWSQRTRFVQGDFIIDGRLRKRVRRRVATDSIRPGRLHRTLRGFSACSKSTGRNGLDSSRATSSWCAHQLGRMHVWSQRTRFVQGDFIPRYSEEG